MESYTRQISDFAANLRLDDVPDVVKTRAKQIILDGFGCALFGAHVPWTNILANTVHRMEPEGGLATVWGRRETASPANAVLVNGTMVQSYELDDGNPAGSIHSSAILLPAAIAAAETVGADKVDGATFLRAIIAGFEVGPRFGLCMSGEKTVRRGWHAPGIFAPFPSAICAGTVLGLTSDQYFHALGIAGTQASGLMAAQFGSMVKRMQCAKGAQSGFYGALLAAEGLTGIENIFEEKFGGYCSTFSNSVDDYDLPALVDGYGTRWETMRIGIKICACAGGNQSAVSAIAELATETGLKAEDVEGITVSVTEGVVKHHGWYPYVPTGLTAAQMHIGYCVAMQLIEGEVFVDQMVEQNVARPDLIELANRVKVVRSIDRERKGNAYRKGCDLEVLLRNGKVLRKTVDHRPGSEQRPLTEDQITQKFRRLAAKTLSSQAMGELANIVRDIDHAKSIVPLIQVLKG